MSVLDQLLPIVSTQLVQSTVVSLVALLIAFIYSMLNTKITNLKGERA